MNTFAHGIDNIAESQYSELEGELNSAYALAIASVKNQSTSSDATHIAVKLQKFIHLMDSMDWDFSRALLDPNTSSAASDLGTQESLQQANAVESFVITKCGMPSTVPFNATAETLPSPSIPSPLATDPPTNGINQNSQAIALGRTLAGIYGVTISESEALCLGNAMDGVVDATSAAANSNEYEAQFNKAFSLCGIHPTESTTG